MDQTSSPNRLIHEKSPYLLQHAYNPIDWFPWGQEAFEKAKSSEQPIFLSIGYATCHWCHVMEKESFRNEKVAQVMNETFINIKMDREEHPEVDKLYMDFAQALMSTGGGWPLNVMLTPELKPFFATTYIAPNSLRGQPGLIDIANEIRRIWHSDQKAVLFDQAEKVVELLQNSINIKGTEVPNEIDLENAFEILYELADPVNGGLKGSPKFPLGYLNSLLLTRAKLKKDSRALYFAELTLDKIAAGGIYDHLGGGFSRYTTDEKWRIPHFEKMLYDNALLATSYTEAWLLTKKDKYQKIVEETLNFVQKDLTDSKGGFYSAVDADTQGKEGEYYLWTRDEIHQLLPPEKAALFCEFYHITAEGNFHGKNVLYYEDSVEDFATKQAMDITEVSSIIEEAKRALFKAREKREKPKIDDKILTSWNALMAKAFLEAGLAFENRQYIDTALNAVQFIQNQLYSENYLLKRYRDGEAKYIGGLSEYSFMIQLLIRLFEAGEGVSWLSWAVELAEKIERDFKDPGGAFYSTEDSLDIILRHCDYYDGAEPSGNAVHTENLLKLYQITQNPMYLLQAEEILKAAKAFMQSYPPGATYNYKSLYRYLDANAKTLIFALPASQDELQLQKTLFKNFLPHCSIVWSCGDDDFLYDMLPDIRDKKPLEEKATLYLCTQEKCLDPIMSIQRIKETLLTI